MTEGGEHDGEGAPTVECIPLLQNVFSYYRMYSLTIECVLLLSNVFPYYRMCSLTTGHQRQKEESMTEKERQRRELARKRAIEEEVEKVCCPVVRNRTPRGRGHGTHLAVTAPQMGRSHHHLTDDALADHGDPVGLDGTSDRCCVV